jgi:hypothetical protein
MPKEERDFSRKPEVIEVAAQPISERIKEVCSL